MKREEAEKKVVEMLQPVDAWWCKCGHPLDCHTIKGECIACSCVQQERDK